ncbi:MAG: MucBP domain-containing protein [Oscillospiraceae bacterium]
MAKLRKILAIVLAVVMITSVCGISALADKQGGGGYDQPGGGSYSVDHVDIAKDDSANSVAVPNSASVVVTLADGSITTLKQSGTSTGNGGEAQWRYTFNNGSRGYYIEDTSDTNSKRIVSVTVKYEVDGQGYTCVISGFSALKAGIDNCPGKNGLDIAVLGSADTDYYFYKVVYEFYKDNTLYYTDSSDTVHQVEENKVSVTPASSKSYEDLSYNLSTESSVYNNVDISSSKNVATKFVTITIRYDYTTPDPEPEMEEWTITHKYYLNGTTLEGSTSATVNVEAGKTPEHSAVTEYNGNVYTQQGNAVVDTGAKTITYTYNRTTPAPEPEMEEWTITHKYYLNGTTLEGSTSATVNVEAGKTPEHSAVTEYNGNVYTQQGNAVVDTGAKTITYTYNRTTPAPEPTPDPIPTPSSYTLTVKYVDEDGSEIAASDVSSRTAGTAYSTSAKEIEGYTFKEWDNSSDAVSGYMTSGKTVVYIYTASEEDISDEDIPLDPAAPDGDEEIDIPDEDAPLDDSPKTGDDSISLTALWCLFILSGLGLFTLAITSKKHGKHQK